jgi:hypothetical protein
VPILLTVPVIVLILTVTGMATAIAYIRPPRIKAVVYTLPLPFLAASFASPVPVDATHALGMFSILAFLTLTMLARHRWRWPILAAEALGLTAFCAIGWVAGRWMPDGDLAFWPTAAGTVAVLLVLRFALPPVDDPGHRTSLPWFVKAPIILAVVLAVTAAREPLRGFMPTFPFVSLFAAYEARHSLRTLLRQFIRFCIGFEALLAAVRLMQHALPGEGWLWVRLLIGVAAGTGAYLLVTGGRLTLPPAKEPPSPGTVPSPADGPRGG